MSHQLTPETVYELGALAARIARFYEIESDFAAIEAQDALEFTVGDAFADVAYRASKIDAPVAPTPRTTDVVVTGAELDAFTDMGSPDMIAPRTPDETRTPAGERQR